MKRCFKCKMLKSIYEFYRHSQMADGHLNKCKECTKIDNRGNRLNKRERYIAYDKERAKKPSRIKALIETMERMRSKFPEKYKARNKLSNALRDGKIIKGNCVVCGISKVEAHHPDYRNPLNVIWLCIEHHKQIHHQNQR